VPRPPKRGGKPLSWTCATCIASHGDAGGALGKRGESADASAALLAIRP
jgi:hypothetical protein